MTPRELAVLSLKTIPQKLLLSTIVEVCCCSCNNIFFKKFSYIVKCCRNRNDKYHCRACSNKITATTVEIINKIRTSNKESGKLKITSKNNWLNQDYRNNITNKSKINGLLESRLRSERMIKLWSNDEYRQLIINSCKNNAHPRFKTHDQFILDAKKIHGDRYNYNETYYEHCEKPVKIICTKCNSIFYQTPMVHLRGCGCPSCPIIISSGHQKIIDHLNNHNIDFTINDRTHGFEIDILINKFNLGIEYHGIYWHSYDHRETTEQRYKHAKKHELCLVNNIKLLQFFEHERIDIIYNMINHSLNLTQCCIGARKCKFGIVEQSEAKDFFNKSHIAGYRYSDITYGLYYGGELMMAVGFSEKKIGWEIMRLATNPTVIVPGGASRLIKRFPHRPLMTYADRRFGTGAVYQKIGMKFDSITKPGYYYVKGNRVFSRIKFQKHKLHKLLENYNPSLSEFDNMIKNGYRRLWDAGHYKYILN